MLRLRLATALLFTIGAGYFLRFHAPAPAWIRDAGGGAAYVIVFSILAAFRLTPGRAALTGFAFACGVEFLQLWHMPLLEAIRRTLPGRLLLGTTFNWGDFPPYAAGAGIAWASLRSLRGR